MENKDLTAIIARCLNGDTRAQEELVLAVQNRVYYHCRKMLKDEDRAFDLTQEVLMVMLTKLDTLREPEAFRGWLSGITANLCRNAINRGPREVQIPEDEEGNSLLDTYETLDQRSVPDKMLDTDETRRMIAELVDALPDVQRQCVLLYYYDEMSVKDIAAVLEVSENTIKSRLNYARKSIKEGVERYEKQGIKLYGLSPLPFLFFFLGSDANACRLTGEQSAQLAQQVIGNAAASSAAGSAAAAASSKVAATAAKKAFLGLSAKTTAAIVAGAVLIGSIAGISLLNGKNDLEGSSSGSRTEHCQPQDNLVNDDLPPDTDSTEPAIDDSEHLPGQFYSMKFMELPDWINLPYDAVIDCFPGDYLLGAFSSGAQRHLQYWTENDNEHPVIEIIAPYDSDRILYAEFDFRRGLEIPIQWLEICAGDSFETVLEKLGFPQASPGVNCIEGYYYTEAPDKSGYTTFYNTILSDNQMAIDLYYPRNNTDESTYDAVHFNFLNRYLAGVSFQFPTGNAQEYRETSAEQPASTQSDATVLDETAPDNSPLLITRGDILLAVDGTYGERSLDTCGEDWLSGIFWEETVTRYLSITPGTGCTVTNIGSNEEAYIQIWCSEYTRSDVSKVITTFDDSIMEYRDVEIMGRYFNAGHGWYLTGETTDRSAGNDLYWNCDVNGITLDSVWNTVIRLYPGQSVTFLLPMNEEASLYRLVLAYTDPGDSSQDICKELYITSDEQ